MSRSLKFAICCLAGMTVCALVARTAEAEEALGPMAGAGGVMRDAERRAVAPATPTKEAQPLPTLAEQAKSGPELGAVRGSVIGPIASVKAHGSVAFAEREKVAERILAALGGDGDKTVGDVFDAIGKVRQELLKDGYYLVTIQLAKKGTYDKATKTLSVLVDEGRFGRVNVTFEEEEDGFWFSKRQIASRFRDIEEGETFDYRRLRSALFDANSHPDLTIDTDIAVRRPIEGEGEDRRVARYADLNLDVHESVPFHAVWSIDNYGLRDVNEWQAS